jgi:hypothetical protein
MCCISFLLIKPHFFSVLRQRAGRFSTTKVGKQTKENVYRTFILLYCECKGVVMLLIVSAIVFILRFVEYCFFLKIKKKRNK